jgi:hypothetical protein
MSSPKRAAKAAGKTAAKVVAKGAGKRAIRRPVAPARPKPLAAVGNGGISAQAKHLAAALERGIVDGKLDVVSADALQALMAAACRLYTARREAGEEFVPVPMHSISATDVMVTASGLLRAGDLAVFELGMWQNWTGR